MDRLTFDGYFCDIVLCFEIPCLHHDACTQRQVWERLKQYEDAEEQGRLIVRDGKDIHVSTNADRIRAMSDEGLAMEFYMRSGTCPPGEDWDECPKDHGEKVTCYGCWLKWIQSPAEGGEQDGAD